MGYLEKKDYKKIKNIIETFIDSPVIIDNLFKSLVLFLKTKNPEEIKIIKETKFTDKPVSIVNAVRVKNEIENADLAMHRFTEKLRKESDKRKRKKSSKVVS